MKSFVIALCAVIMSSPFALANGCNSHDKETVMVCESGQQWDEALNACVDVSA